MKVNNIETRSVWYDVSSDDLIAIDQTLLPFQFQTIELKTVEDIIAAIKSMQIRGAPAIGIAASYAVYFAVKQCGGNVEYFNELLLHLISSRPTAVNLRAGALYVANSLKEMQNQSDSERIALLKANEFAEMEIRNCELIGINGVEIIKNIYKKNQRPINILTHCNAGWLACGDWGTATAPIYLAHRTSIPLHIWVDETRPLNQGARLTAWEMKNEGIDFTIITDNAGGMLMQDHKVDLVIVGADRIARNGDTANKIGTYLKAVVAFANQIPFYVAAPFTTIDMDSNDGKSIIIEERNPREVSHIIGLNNKGIMEEVQIIPDNYGIYNPAFDVTPHDLITGIITERGIINTGEIA